MKTLVEVCGGRLAKAIRTRGIHCEMNIAPESRALTTAKADLKCFESKPILHRRLEISSFKRRENELSKQANVSKVLAGIVTEENGYD